MVSKTVPPTTIVNGYEFIRMADGNIYPDAIEFCPYSGKECPNSFLWELQHQIHEILAKRNQEALLLKLFDKKLLSSQFNFINIPPQLKFLLTDKKWFYDKICVNKNDHKEHELCGGFASFLDSLYSETVLPPITRKPIQFCPFCGIRLKSGFNEDNWWRNRSL